MVAVMSFDKSRNTVNGNKEILLKEKGRRKVVLLTEVKATRKGVFLVHHSVAGERKTFRFGNVIRAPENSDFPECLHVLWANESWLTAGIKSCLDSTSLTVQ
jgi:hypothetical protein